MSMEVTTKTGMKAVVKPLHDMVLVQMLPAEEKRGNIFIPVDAQERRRQGIVVATGPGKFNEFTDGSCPMPVGRKDRVIFGKWAGTDLQMDGKDLMLVKVDDILAVIDQIPLPAAVSKDKAKA